MSNAEPYATSEQILMIPVHISEEAIRQSAEQACVKMLIRETEKVYFHGGYNPTATAALEQIVQDAVANVIEQYRDIVIDKVNDSLIRRISNSKAFRDAFGSSTDLLKTILLEAEE